MCLIGVRLDCIDFGVWKVIGYHNPLNAQPT